MRRFAWLAVAAACLLPALLPGDAPWINDEPILILQALRANQRHELARVGLQGTHALHYGPLPIWLYQGFLLVSHDVRALVVVRALLVMAGSAAGLWLLARALEVSPWLLVLPLLSPYLWIYSREIWDNTFCLPLGALALGGYAQFLSRPSRWALVLAALAGAALLLVHLMSVALLAALLLHALFLARPKLWSYRWTLLALAVAAAVICGPYLLLLAHERVPSPPSSPPPGWWSFPLLSPRLLSAQGFEYFFGGPVWTPAELVTWIAFPLTWLGALWSALSLRKRPWSARQELMLLLLLALAADEALVLLTGAVGHPHYYNAIWAVAAGLMWIALDRLPSFVPLIQGCALLAVTAVLAVRIHLQGGTRTDHYGPTLGNQIALARALDEYDPRSSVAVGVENLARFPQSLSVLRALDPPTTTIGRPHARLFITYLGQAPDAHAVLREY